MTRGYTRSDGTSIYPPRPVPIVGWRVLERKHSGDRNKRRRHLAFEDGSLGCRSDDVFARFLGPVGEGEDKPKCKACIAVEERYKREAGVELYSALHALVEEIRYSRTAGGLNIRDAIDALRKARNGGGLE